MDFKRSKDITKALKIGENYCHKSFSKKHEYLHYYDHVSGYFKKRDHCHLCKKKENEV